MSTITLRATKGSPLTNTEVDSNFSNLNTDKLEATYSGAMNSLTGGTSIATVGTITTGTWSATAIGATKGGTGQTTYATGDLLYASASNTLSKLAKPASASYLKMDSAGTPSWDTLGLDDITATGTITTGTWNATTIGTGYGGTGLTSFTSGGLLYASSTSALTTGSALTFDGTNLGIGTSSPVAGYRLNVVNDSGNAQQLIRAGTNYNSTIAFGDQDSSTSGQLIYAHNGDYMAFNINASERIRIDSSGNVGIGTSSPAQRLDVVTSGGNAYIRVARNTQSAGQVGLHINGGTSGTDWYLFNPSSSNDFVFFGNGTERMRIDSSGNVGIGTSSPAQKLDVNGGARFATSQWVQFGTNNTFYADSSYGLIIKAPATSNFIAFRSSNDTECMRITSAGGISFGSSGTAYGTSGQVLTSNGNSAPTWQTSTAATTGKAIAMAMVFGG